MKLKILQIAAIILLLTSFLSGCTSTEEDKFVGTWETEDKSLKLVIYEDGECNFMSGDGTWELKNNTLLMVIRFTGGKNTMSYIYSFSEDGKELTLSDTSGRYWIYTKQ